MGKDFWITALAARHLATVGTTPVFDPFSMRHYYWRSTALTARARASLGAALRQSIIRECAPRIQEWPRSRPQGSAASDRALFRGVGGSNARLTAEHGHAQMVPPRLTTPTAQIGAGCPSNPGISLLPFMNPLARRAFQRDLDSRQGLEDYHFCCKTGFNRSTRYRTAN